MLTWWPLHHTVENFFYAAPGVHQAFYAAPDGLQDPLEVHARGSREAENKL